MKKKMRILIGYDGSCWAKAAIEDLQRAGLPQKVDAVVLSVADIFVPQVGRYTESNLPESVVTVVRKSQAQAAETMQKARALAAEGGKMLHKLFPLWEVATESSADSPAWGILEKAREWKADLIVVGAHGMSATSRLFFGSVSHRVAVDAPCSVRIVHSKPEEIKSPCRIIIGMDRSMSSKKAVFEAASREWMKGTAVHLITVIDPRIVTAIAADEHPRWIHRLTEKAAKKLQNKGLAVTCLTKEGDPKQVLLEEAREWGADAIFVGARGLSSIKHFLVGSVSGALAARAHCTVEIVRTHVRKDKKASTGKWMNEEIAAEAYD